MTMTTSRYCQVYLMRHGIAAERGTYADDRQRPLIDKGILKTEKIAQRLQALGIYFDTLLTSPLVRAEQTAKILCQVGVAKDYQVFEPLAPEGALQDWVNWLATWPARGQKTLALVGHEPDLSQWAQMLVHGTADHRWVLKKAGIIGLLIPCAGNPVGASQLCWLTPPRLIL